MNDRVYVLVKSPVSDLSKDEVIRESTDYATIFNDMLKYNKQDAMNTYWIKRHG